MNSTTVTRRDFLKTGGMISGGLLISFFVPAGAKSLLNADKNVSAFFAPNAYLNIGSDGIVKILLAHAEMGQGIWTTLPMLIVEELDCDWSKISVEHAPADQPYIHTMYGIQITGGSSTTWSEFDRYRNAGATARTMLIEAAAKQFRVQPSECHTEKGFVIAGNNRASYGDLAQAASRLSPPATVRLKDKKDWKYIGKSTKRIDTKGKINGEAIFGMDVYLEGMSIAVPLHAPVFGATVRSFDAKAAKAIKGVVDVVQVPTGVAVIADNFWAAKQGRDALKVDWNLGDGENINSASQFDAYKKLAASKGATAAQAGNTKDALSKASKKVEAEYIFPYLAHAPMEPLNCTVRITGDGCEIWTGTQMPMLDQAAVAKILGLKNDQVRIKYYVSWRCIWKKSSTHL